MLRLLDEFNPKKNLSKMRGLYYNNNKIYLFRFLRS